MSKNNILKFFKPTVNTNATSATVTNADEKSPPTKKQKLEVSQNSENRNVSYYIAVYSCCKNNSTKNIFSCLLRIKLNQYLWKNKQLTSKKN